MYVVLYTEPTIFSNGVLVCVLNRRLPSHTYCTCFVYRAYYWTMFIIVYYLFSGGGGRSVFFFVIVSLSCPNCPTNLSAIFFLEVLQAHFSNWKWTWHLACWQLQRNGSEIELGLSTTNYVRVLDSMTSSLHIYVRSPSTVTIKQTRINPINHTYPTVFNSA